MNRYTISNPSKEEYPQLDAVWESSVKATHHFLSEEDFNFYKNLITTFFDNIQLKALKEDNTILGFIGTDKESLEMLFVEALERGKGIGKELLLYALENLGITKVEVNQDNHHAVAFYSHFGFETRKVSEVDGFGKPYPILHIELKK